MQTKCVYDCVYETQRSLLKYTGCAGVLCLQHGKGSHHGLNPVTYAEPPKTSPILTPLSPPCLQDRLNYPSKEQFLVGIMESQYFLQGSDS